jgi:uncharacterized GH25 family protein
MNRHVLARVALVTIGFLLATAGVAAAHDLFLKPHVYRVREQTRVLVRVLNGTFSKSENSIDRVRLLDVSIVSPAGRARLDTSAWSTTGDTSTFHVQTGAAGTYVLGASTRASVIALEAKDFNEYLRSDGIPDVLAARRRAAELERPARERYHKHVKAIIQVGDRHTGEWSTVLGYPAEIIPLENPYTVKPGQVLRVRTLVNGAPVANQLVMYGGRGEKDVRFEPRTTRSDTTGIAQIPLTHVGTWYVKFIHMTRMQRDTVDYESRWASLTFSIE